MAAYPRPRKYLAPTAAACDWSWFTKCSGRNPTRRRTTRQPTHNRYTSARHRTRTSGSHGAEDLIVDSPAPFKRHDGYWRGQHGGRRGPDGVVTHTLSTMRAHTGAGLHLRSAHCCGRNGCSGNVITRGHRPDRHRKQYPMPHSDKYPIRYLIRYLSQYQGRNPFADEDVSLGRGRSSSMARVVDIGVRTDAWHSKLGHRYPHDPRHAQTIWSVIDGLITVDAGSQVGRHTAGQSAIQAPTATPSKIWSATAAPAWIRA